MPSKRYTNPNNPVRHNVVADTTGMLQKMMETTPALPTVEGASVLLVKLIDESTREKEGGQFVHVDGTRLPW